MTRQLHLQRPTMFDDSATSPTVVAVTCGRCGRHHAGEFFTRVNGQWIGDPCLLPSDTAVPAADVVPLGPTAVPDAWINSPAKHYEEDAEV